MSQNKKKKNKSRIDNFVVAAQSLIWVSLSFYHVKTKAIVLLR